MNFLLMAISLRLYFQFKKEKVANKELHVAKGKIVDVFSAMEDTFTRGQKSLLKLIRLRMEELEDVTIDSEFVDYDHKLRILELFQAVVSLTREAEQNTGQFIELTDFLVRKVKPKRVFNSSKNIASYIFNKFEKKASLRGMEIDFELEDNLKNILCSQASLFGPILDNVIDNAIIHGIPTRNIEVKIKRMDDYALISVFNEASHISKELIEKALSGKGKDMIFSGLSILKQYIEVNDGILVVNTRDTSFEQDGFFEVLIYLRLNSEGAKEQSSNSEFLYKHHSNTFNSWSRETRAPV